MRSVEAMLRDLDLRVRRIEVVLAARSKSIRDRPPPGVRRPRGRPRGSGNIPPIKVGRPLFPEHALTGGELIARSVLEGWVTRSEKRRASVLSAVVDDDRQWRPVKGSDAGARAWERLCSLRAYCEAINELPALREALKLVEHVPDPDPELMRAGLRLVNEFVQLKVPKGQIGPSPAQVAAE